MSNEEPSCPHGARYSFAYLTVRIGDLLKTEPSVSQIEDF
jgi:hypothetical protein